MSYDMGFCGTGNMGAALARAAAKSGGTMLLCNRTPSRAEALARELGCDCGTNETAAAQADVLFLGVKPAVIRPLLASLLPILEERTEKPVLVSMAAGVTVAAIREASHGLCPVVRIMPNLPVALGQGVVLLSPDDTVTEAQLQKLEAFLAGAGLLLRLPEEKIDAGCAVSGCGPAFVYQFLDAMAMGGVACGLSYSQSLALAAQTVAGAATMTLESGKHPGTLTAEVCSPGGSTVAGVRALEAGGLRSAAMEAVIAACRRTAELGK